MFLEFKGDWDSVFGKGDWDSVRVTGIVYLVSSNISKDAYGQIIFYYIF